MRRGLLVALIFCAAAFSQTAVVGLYPVVVSAQYPAADFICALHADTVAGAPACSNAVTDGTTETAFASTYTIPAGTLVAGVTYRAHAIIRFFDGATSTSVAAFSLYYGATRISTNFNTIAMPNTFSQTMESAWTITAASASSLITGWTMNNSQSNANVNGTAQPVAVTSTADAAITVKLQYTAATAGNGAQLLALLIYRDK